MDSVLWLDTMGPVAALTRAVGSTEAISAVLAERAAISTPTTEVSVAALDKVDLGIEDNHVAFLDAIADFHLRPQIPCHGYFSDVGVTTVDYGDLQAVAIENDRLGGHQKARCVMRNMKLDPAVGPGFIAPSGFGMSISVSSVRVPGSSAWQYARHFAGESATGQL